MKALIKPTAPGADTAAARPPGAPDPLSGPSPQVRDLRILFVQFSNFAEAVERLRAGGPETYRDQRITVGFVVALSEANDVTTVVVGEPEAHEERLGPRLRCIGLTDWAPHRREVARLFDSIDPDVVICRAPIPTVLREASARRIPVLAAFADVFRTTGLRSALRNRRLGRLLRSGNITCVSNHNLHGSRAMARELRLPTDRVVPWEWSRLRPRHGAKSGPADPGAPRLIQVGALSEEKGAGDALAALRRLRDGGRSATLTLIGSGDHAAWRSKAERMGLADAVSVLEPVPMHEVQPRMHDHDIVLLPSRHDCAEGLPSTIYEALASGSPLVVSDHPAFRGRLRPDAECVVARAGDPVALVEALARLSGDRALYARVSAQAPGGLDRLHVGLAWPELVGMFLADPRNATGWVAHHSLARLDA